VPVAPDQVRDPVAALIPGRGRDPERSPMRWDDRPGAGFTTGTPWLPLGDPAVNVAAQRDDPGSMLALHRRLLALRHDSPALSAGAYEPVQADGDVLAYLRTGDDGQAGGPEPRPGRRAPGRRRTRAGRAGHDPGP
jgi:alpha-glucosidase